ncbi:MAG TPA: SbcC/MukB-like Walker B domain-containing protein [Anaerovoracaceae bacterium]|nr:SbcC/MukB-like Walker B domain-containing protein [Anaerovoracaceae bacterium]
MKKLTKTLLINWLYYEKELVSFDTINFLTGKTASGKTTFIDALQIVLLGELSGRNFNKAANESSERTLRGYLRADMDNNNPYSRKARAFETYIACEFSDDFVGRSFTIGIVFDCYNDGSERHQFFSYDGPIPENCFIENRKPMDISELRAYIKANYKTRGEMYDSNKKYKSAISAKWNIHTDQIFGMLKKAVSFRPIVDIQNFITENVCDLPDRPDIAAMQQNIQDYKHQERLARRQEEKQAALKNIQELHISCERTLSRMRLHQYLFIRAGKQIEESAVLKLENERRDKTELSVELTARYETLESEINGLNKRLEQLISDRANSDVFRERERLDQQKVLLESERGRLLDELKNAAQDIRLEAFQWLGFCGKLSGGETIADHVFDISNLTTCLDGLQTQLKKVEQFSPEDFGRIELSVFEVVQQTMRAFKNQLDESYYHADKLLSEKKQEYDSNSAAVAKLQKGVKDYDKRLLRLQQTIEEELVKKFGQEAHVHILADLLEISDETWQGAIEGYLNTQKFYLLVEPTYYQSALHVLNDAKRREDLHGYGLVDIGKLRENEKLRRDPESLAAVVETKNSLARSYIDYLLGRVVRCMEVSELRKYRTAITPEGMLYQGYVARPLSRALMNDAYIGKLAIKKRLERLELAQQTLSETIKMIQATRDLLSKQKGKEPLITERYVQTVIRDSIDKFSRTEELSVQLTDLNKAYDALDLTWLVRISDVIESVRKDLNSKLGEKEQCSNQRELCKKRLHELEYEDLPDHYQALQKKEDELKDLFSSEYTEKTGEPRYQEELQRLKTANSIFNNFGHSRQEQSKKEYDDSRRKLVYARRDYVNAYPPCRFIPDAMDNDEFSAELQRLSESELPKYKEKIQKARESAFEQFQNDFLAKLKTNIDSVQAQVRDLNRALQKAQFGTDSYRFIVTRHPDYAEYYDMIMDPDLMEESGGLFSLSFLNRYGALIETLFSRIVSSDDSQLNERKQSELQANIQRYTDYRTYLHFDLETTDQNGNVQLLSKTLNTKSGGETQTPFYIAILASFAQIYRVNDTSSFGNTMRLVIFDEAFNKMDSERITESIRLLRKMKLQAVICTPPDKLPDIMPEVDRTLLVLKDGYRMQILPWSKDLEVMLDE